VLQEHVSLSPLTAVCPVDGRYGAQTAALRGVFSEWALMRNRVRVEVAWLQALAASPALSAVEPLDLEAEAFLGNLAEDFSEDDAKRVQEIERTTRHDVKAVEYWIKEKCAQGPAQVAARAEFVHFACTSEDINNLAYALMLREAQEEILLPQMLALETTLVEKAEKYHSQPMLARTHGQPATPTTLGKEFANFAFRMARQRKQFECCEILGKMNGAVGNFAAHMVAVPRVDWPTMTKAFIEERLKLKCNPYTTQIEPHDFIAEICDTCSRFNTVTLDMNRDMWGYISLGYFRQKVVAGEVGSSTMPHKTNPINFENSEGNLGLANATFNHLASKLPVSRFQRDLSDSTVMRALGVGFAHSMIAYKNSLQGLDRIDANREKMEDDLNQNWEVLAEPIQTIMRRLGKQTPYEQLKDLTKGKQVSQKEMEAFVNNLDMPREDKDALLRLTPGIYTGNSSNMASEVRKYIAELS